MMPKPSALLRLALLGGAILVFDQITKVLVLRTLGPGRAIEVIPGFFSLVCNFNTGAAFGLLSGSQTLLAVVSLVAMVVLPFLIRASLSKGSPTLGSYGLMAILAGDVGNLVDRIFRAEGVVDFLYFYIGRAEDPLAGWFPFNVADSAICVGVGAYLLNSYRSQKRKREGRGEQPATSC